MAISQTSRRTNSSSLSRLIKILLAALLILGSVAHAEEVQVSVTVPGDTDPPYTFMEITGAELQRSGWFIEQPEVTLLCDEPGLIEYMWTGQTWSFYQEPIYPSQGISTLFYKATDLSGNIELQKDQEFKVDLAGPEVTVDVPSIDNYLYQIGTGLSFTASDVVSGIDQVWGDLDDGMGVIQTVSDGFTPEPGVYQLTVGASDIAGHNVTKDPQMLVIYDPNGGFATGAGWLIVDDESDLFGDGAANFGFNIRYKRSQSTGTLQFNYNAAEINLQSSSISWMAISGVSAQFQGVGTINGGGMYTFSVRASDKSKQGAGADSFDIKIWEGTDTSVDPYHKAKNVISSGNIMVRKR